MVSAEYAMIIRHHLTDPVWCINDFTFVSYKTNCQTNAKTRSKGNAQIYSTTLPTQGMVRYRFASFHPPPVARWVYSPRPSTSARRGCSRQRRALSGAPLWPHVLALGRRRTDTLAPRAVSQSDERPSGRAARGDAAPAPPASPRLRYARRQLPPPVAAAVGTDY